MEPILLAKSNQDLYLLPRMANRHGMIAGATGTGKTVTLQVMAEQFSAIGVPVFLADVKGDLAGVSQPGTATPKIQERAKMLKLGDIAFEVDDLEAELREKEVLIAPNSPSPGVRVAFIVDNGAPVEFLEMSRAED